MPTVLTIEGYRKINIYIVHAAIMFILKMYISPNTNDMLKDNLSIIQIPHLLINDSIWEKH